MARMAQLVKAWIFILRIAGSSLTSSGKPLTPNTSVASDPHGKNNGGPSQWIIRIKISTRLLKITSTTFSIRAAGFRQVTCEQIAQVDQPPMTIHSVL